MLQNSENLRDLRSGESNLGKYFPAVFAQGRLVLADWKRLAVQAKRSVRHFQTPLGRVFERPKKTRLDKVRIGSQGSQLIDRSSRDVGLVQ